MAHGGFVQGFCDSMGAHHGGCEYFSQGGEVTRPTPQDHPSVTLGRAAVHHGFHGLVKNVGRSRLADAQKHIGIIEDAKTQYNAKANGTWESFDKTMGHKLGSHLHEKNHEGASEKLHGHPLVGAIGKNHLPGVIATLSPALMDKESHPEAMRGAVDFLHSAIRGQDQLKSAMRGLIGKSGDIAPEKGSRESIKDFLKSAQENPSEILDVGGTLGHYLPDQASSLGAMTATAVDYLKTLKPTQTQASPLDEPTPIDKMAEEKYNRALDIAAQPLVILQHVKDGTLLPADIETLKTIFPGLHHQIVEQLGERLIDAGAKDEEIPYKQKITMSLLLGQPLDSTMTAQSMQAIIRSAGPQQAQKQAEKQGEGLNSAELKTITKDDELSALPDQRRLLNRK